MSRVAAVTFSLPMHNIPGSQLSCFLMPFEFVKTLLIRKTIDLTSIFAPVLETVSPSLLAK